MPLLRVNAGSDGPALHGSAQALHPALLRHAQGEGPVIVMIHGYKFRPGDPVNCPHRHIFALHNGAGCRRAISWPRRLGVATPEGLGIAFGWNGSGTLWQARRSALRAGESLSALLCRLHRLAPHRPVHLIAHSLGAQVVFSALEHLAPGILSRIVVLNGAAYQSQASAALSSPAGKRVELFNIATRENAFYDFLFERLIRPGLRGDRALGRGFHARNAVTLRIDDPALLCRLAPHGVCIGKRARSICHWSTYLRPGVFDLYRDLFHSPHRFPLTELRRITEAAAQGEAVATPDRSSVLLLGAKRAS